MVSIPFGSYRTVAGALINDGWLKEFHEIWDVMKGGRFGCYVLL